MDISTIRFKTTDTFGKEVDFSDEQVDISINIYNSFSISKDAYIAYRGVDENYLSDRFVTENDSFTENQVMDRLFYFGDKSKAYLKSRAKKSPRKYLNNIEDCSKKTGKYIFDKYRKLRKSKNQNILDYVKESALISYFFDSANRQIFGEAIEECGQGVRDYYLSFLHRVGNYSISNNSYHISSSLEFDAAKNFAGVKSGYILFFMHRKSEILKGRKEVELLLKKHNLPLINNENILYPEQSEVTVRAGLYPNDIYGVLNIFSKVLWVNPHIFSKFNKDSDLTVNRLIIPQSKFNKKLADETNYSGYSYTYNHQEFYEGNIKV